MKKDKILLDGKDITSTLNKDERDLIFEEAKAISLDLKFRENAKKETKKAQKEAKKAEKAQKKAEKAQKNAEKALKEKEKFQKRYEQAQTNLEKAQKKYKKLKKKGKLSPIDERKWLDKIDKLQSKVNKAHSKM
ncbi:hypothetical protein [Winogradskyella vincentii]|uniref:Colicin import membrane protein n=1 Tax=Winogradskyella vincentii TaxID=2877122 RepID=A0ABS7XZX7_9FLAO|nr:hypothetical protein [Winogradskyella vincentii]MCA0152172.1 hypothetical protein [Winogradskyella vincentii]